MRLQMISAWFSLRKWKGETWLSPSNLNNNVIHLGAETSEKNTTVFDHLLTISWSSWKIPEDCFIIQVQWELILEMYYLHEEI